MHPFPSYGVADDIRFGHQELSLWTYPCSLRFGKSDRIRGRPPRWGAPPAQVVREEGVIQPNALSGPLLTVFVFPQNKFAKCRPNHLVELYISMRVHVVRVRVARRADRHDTLSVSKNSA